MEVVRTPHHFLVLSLFLEGYKMAKKFKTVKAYGFLDRHGNLTATSLPQSFAVLKKEAYPNLVEIEIRPINKPERRKG